MDDVLRDSINRSFFDLPTNDTRDVRAKYTGGPLSLHNSDHPSMILVTSVLTGNNYFSWSRSIQMAPGAKVKLGFMNGKCEYPSEDSQDTKQWVRYIA